MNSKDGATSRRDSVAASTKFVPPADNDKALPAGSQQSTSARAGGTELRVCPECEAQVTVCEHLCVVPPDFYGAKFEAITAALGYACEAQEKLYADDSEAAVAAVDQVVRILLDA